MLLRYYIYARLKTEELIEADYESMPIRAFESRMDELVLIWETADALSSGAENVTDRALLLLDEPSVSQTAAYGQPKPQFATLTAKESTVTAIPLADNAGVIVDRRHGRKTCRSNMSRFGALTV